jgi:capsular polysaccharide biosynthesis protein
MDRAILIFAVLGVLMFVAYLYFIIKTSYDDEKQKKLDKQKEEETNLLNGKVDQENKN